VVFSSCRYSSDQNSNLANKIGEWGGGAKSTVRVRDFNLERCEGGERGKIGLNQFFIYIHPFLPLSSKLFYFAVSISTEKPYSCVEKCCGEDIYHLPTPPQFSSMPGPTDTLASNMFVF
jgi:hypothetical protein